jgi:ABC-type phosphate transport system ATPase subunit
MKTKKLTDARLKELIERCDMRGDVLVAGHEITNALRELDRLRARITSANQMLEDSIDGSLEAHHADVFKTQVIEMLERG